MTQADGDHGLLALTAEIVAAYVASHKLPADEIAGLVQSVHGALATAGAPVQPAVSLKPASAAQIRKSITPDALISFIDGKPYKSLRRHIGNNGLTVEAYRARFGLPDTYPLVAPRYSEARSALAKAAGLGLKGRQAGAKTAP